MQPQDTTILSLSPGQTRQIGLSLGRAAGGDTCIALIGALGAGKTQLTQGIAQGADVPEDITVNSPTFVIVNEYPGRAPVFHIDAYRLNGADELAALGFDEMIQSNSIVIIEWADRVSQILPDDHLSVTIEHAGREQRRLTFHAGGGNARRLLHAVTPT